MTVWTPIERKLARALGARWFGDVAANSPSPLSATAWHALADTAIAHGLGGLWLQHCRAAADSLQAPPTDVIQRLQQVATATAANNLNAMAQVAPLLEACRRNGVRVMLLKGAVLNSITYDRPDLRPMTDIDWLIRPQDVEPTVNLLEANGCQAGADLVRGDFFPKFYYEREFFRPGPVPLRIDLHARPFRPLRLARLTPDDALWTNALSLAIGDTETCMPAPAAMLIHLAAHAAFHGCGRLLWLYDMHRCATQPPRDIDWELLLALTRRWHLTAAVREGLAATEVFGRLACPPDVLERLRTARTAWQDRLVLRAAPHDAQRPVRHVLINALCAPGLRFRFGYLRAVLLPDAKHLAESYPYRHPGWKVMAMSLRALQPLTRLAGWPIRQILSKLGRRRGSVGFRKEPC